MAFGRDLFKRSVPLWLSHSSTPPSEVIPAIKRQARSASVGRRSRRASGARPRTAGASRRGSYLRRRVSTGTAKSAAVVMAANRAVKRMSITDIVFVSAGWGQERRPCERRSSPPTRPLKKEGGGCGPRPPIRRMRWANLLTHAHLRERANAGALPLRGGGLCRDSALPLIFACSWCGGGELATCLHDTDHGWRTPGVEKRDVFMLHLMGRLPDKAKCAGV